MKPKIIKEIIQYLKDEKIYTDKDELTIMMLENTYTQYVLAVKDVKQNGQTLIQRDYNKNEKVVINPAFRNQMEPLARARSMLLS